MRAAINSSGWAKLEQWEAATPDRFRSVHLEWSRGHWTVQLYEHVPGGSAVAAFGAARGTAEEFGAMVDRAILYLEDDRVRVKQRALDALAALTG